MKRHIALVAASLILALALAFPAVRAQGGGRNFSCFVAVSTATTLTAVGGDCRAPTGGESIYITDISFSTNAAGIAADSYNTLKYGSGGSCGSGAAAFWGAMTTAAVQQTTFESFRTPIKIPAGNELCWINTTAGSKTLTVNGFIGSAF